MKKYFTNSFDVLGIIAFFGVIAWLIYGLYGAGQLMEADKKEWCQTTKKNLTLNEFQMCKAILAN